MMVWDFNIFILVKKSRLKELFWVASENQEGACDYLWHS